MAILPTVRAALDRASAIVAGLGLRPYTVSIRTETWSGARVGAGTCSTSDVALSPVPLVQQNTGANAKSWYGGGFITGANGMLELLEYRVGPITKPFTGSVSGGYTIDQLVPANSAANKRTLVWLTGDGFLSGGEPFLVQHVDAQDPFTWTLYVRRRPVSAVM